MSIELVAKAKKTRLGGDSTAKLLLIVLADYANDEGMAWPSIATMANEVEKSERSIQLLLRKLEKQGLISKGDQKLVGKYAKGRRPVVYKLFPKTKKAEKPHDDNENRGEASFTPETGFTGETSFTPQVKQASPHGRNPLHPTGETHCAEGVKPTSPKPSIEPPIEPSRESTRAQQPETEIERSFDQRRQALADYRPTPDLTALAEDWGLDPEWELGKFRDTCLAEGKIPHDPASAYRKWLKRGRELNIGKPAPPTTAEADASGSELERRARKLLATSTPLRQRQPDDRERLRWLPQVASRLAQGTSPAHVVDLVCEAYDRGELDEAA